MTDIPMNEEHLPDVRATDDDLLQAARDIARRAHAGQVDKSGAEYIVHPARVAARVRALGGDAEAVAAAWLHDVIEDTEVTAAGLAAAGIPAGVVGAVELLSKRPGQELADYCAGVRANPVALLVKRADLEDNTDPGRAALLDEPTRQRLAEKYARTRALLGLPA